MTQPPDPDPKQGPELVFGIVGPIGTPTTDVVDELKWALKAVQYESHTIRLIELLKEVLKGDYPDDEDLAERFGALMDAGNDFRAKIHRGDALAGLGIHSVRQLREELGYDPDNPAPRTAYIFRSLKRKEEVETLRSVYGPGFFLVAAYSPREKRTERLTGRIGGLDPTTEDKTKAERLVARDQKDAAFIRYGQDVGGIFPLADVFINTSDAQSMKDSIGRFVELIFGNHFRTPSKDEHAMFMAHGTSLRSAALGRQVGAAIVDMEGEVIALGTNEVNKAGGGHYWEGDDPDRRAFNSDRDTNDLMKERVLSEVLRRLKSEKALSDEYLNKGTAELLELGARVTAGTRLASLIEFGREVHAEMDALMSCVRRGVAVSGGTLFATTFPCHECARHIIAAGLRRVVYIEPYAKSLAENLHPDEMCVDQPGQQDKVCFDPFVGVAPRMYPFLFKMRDRKDETGRVRKWDSYTKMPILVPPHLSYLDLEDDVGVDLEKAMGNDD